LGGTREELYKKVFIQSHRVTSIFKKCYLYITPAHGLVVSKCPTKYTGKAGNRQGRQGTGREGRE